MLTLGQLQALKANIEADAVLNAFPNNSDGAFAISSAYSQIPAPAFVVWKTNVTEQEIMQNNFDWTRVDNLSVGKARIWEWLFKFGSINAANANIRVGIDRVWVGTQADLDVRAVVYAHCKRSANRAEKLFATGAGSDAVPATMVFQGLLGIDDILQARSLA
jgi:hypothetical protein